MKKILLVALLSLFASAESTFSDPQPSFDNPRKVVINMHYAELDRVSHVIGSIYNILKEYPDGSLNVAVVAYAKGMRVLKKGYDEHTQKRISSLMEYDVEFIGCRNTMETMKWKDEDFMDGISFVQAGIVEIIERKVDGWTPITPY
jgi:intracellular sulfur oxidation DsrE/DsrF family protein